MKSRASRSTLKEERARWDGGCAPRGDPYGPHVSIFKRFWDPLEERFSAVCVFLLGLGRLICDVGFQVCFSMGLGMDMTLESEVGCVEYITNTMVFVSTSLRI